MRRRNLLSENNEDVIYNINIIDYLTIEALEDGLTASLSVNACEYCFNGDGNWKTLAAGTATESINTGQILSFRGNLTPNSSNGIGTFTVNKRFNLKGNVMSMLFGDAGKDNYSLSGKDYAFYKLFYSCDTLIKVSDDFLTATTLADNCYRQMFYNCDYLTTAPKLPAIKAPMGCYAYMFYHCNSLKKAPKLFATEIAGYACEEMFGSCTSLTTAPELPATTLVGGSCYNRMFHNCTSLTTAPELPATKLVIRCYAYMFFGCTKLTTAPKLPATTLMEACYSNMFLDCTSLTTAPALPATTLAYECYYAMFNGCTNLTTAPELPATTLAENCYFGMFSGCTKLNYIKMLATDISASNCLNNWVYGVASTGTFVKHPDMTTLPTGTSGIPSGWTVQSATL